VVDERDLLWHAQRHQVADSHEGEDDGKEGQRRGLRLEASRIGLSSSAGHRPTGNPAAYHAHGLSQNVNQSLVGDRRGVCKEEEA